MPIVLVVFMMQYLGTSQYERSELIRQVTLVHYSQILGSFQYYGQIQSYIGSELDIAIDEKNIAVQTLISQNMPLDYDGETDVTTCSCEYI